MLTIVNQLMWLHTCRIAVHSSEFFHHNFHIIAIELLPMHTCATFCLRNIIKMFAKYCTMTWHLGILYTDKLTNPSRNKMIEYIYMYHMNIRESAPGTATVENCELILLKSSVHKTEGFGAKVDGTCEILSVKIYNSVSQAAVVELAHMIRGIHTLSSSTRKHPRSTSNYSFT